VASLGSWTHRGGTYSDGYIWILTLKRIYAEGLQQGKCKKRISMRTGRMAEKLDPKEIVSF
jgi:hypothetical protein